MASSHQTPHNDRPDEILSLAHRPQEKAIFKTNSNYSNNCNVDANGRTDSSAYGGARQDFIITAHTPVNTWSITPIKSSARHPKARKAAIHAFPSQELNNRYDEPKLSPPISDCSMEIDVYQQPMLFDISSYVGSQMMSSDDWSCVSEKAQQILTTHCNGQIDHFASASTQNAALTPNRTWTISPLKSSRRNSNRPSYPSQELNNQYDALLSSLPDTRLVSSPRDFTRTSHTEGTDSIATSSSKPRAPETTTSMATEPSQDLSPNVGGRRSNGAAPEKVQNDDRFREEKSRSNRAQFFSSRRRKTISSTEIAIIPNSLDILRGRGGLTNRWPGNLRFREEARQLRASYREEGRSPDEKYLLTWELVNRVDEYGGRFLQIGADKQWYEMNDQDARKKASQVLREEKWV